MNESSDENEKDLDTIRIESISQNNIKSYAHFITAKREEISSSHDASISDDLDIHMFPSASEINSSQAAYLRRRSLSSNNYKRPIKPDIYLSIDGGLCRLCWKRFSQHEVQDCRAVVGCAGGCRRYFHKNCCLDYRRQCPHFYCPDCYNEMGYCFCCGEKDPIGYLWTCVHPLCGRRFHINCLEKWGRYCQLDIIKPSLATKPREKYYRRDLDKRFICPSHFCCRCPFDPTTPSRSSCVPSAPQTLRDPLLLVYCVACPKSFHTTCLDPTLRPLTLEGINSISEKHRRSGWGQGRSSSDLRLLNAVERVMRLAQVRETISHPSSEKKASPIRFLSYCLCEQHDPAEFPGIEAGLLTCLEEIDRPPIGRKVSPTVSPSIVSLRALPQSLERLDIPLTSLRGVPPSAHASKTSTTFLVSSEPGKRVPESSEGPLKHAKYGFSGIPKNVRLILPHGKTKEEFEKLDLLPFYWIKRNVNVTGSVHRRTKKEMSSDHDDEKCLCKTTCDFERCTNAQTYVECNMRTCALPRNSQKQFCHNRNFARKMQPQLELKYISDRVGWGVFARESLPQNTFVVEYVGELITSAEKQLRLEGLVIPKKPNLQLREKRKERQVAREPKDKTQTYGKGKRKKDQSPATARKRRKMYGETRTSNIELEGGTAPIIVSPHTPILPRAELTPCSVSPTASQSLKSHWYIMDVESGLVIDSELYGNISRLINHSCNPNCVAQKWKVGQESRVGIWTLRSIKAGEQITYDYSFATAGDGFECLCGSAKCRGRVGVSRRAKALYVIERDSEPVLTTKEKIEGDLIQTMHFLLQSGKQVDGLSQFRQLRRIMTPATVSQLLKSRSPREMEDIVHHSVFADELAPIALTAALFSSRTSVIKHWESLKLKTSMILTSWPWVYLAVDCGREDFEIAKSYKLFLPRSHSRCRGNLENLIATRFQLLDLDNHPMWTLINEGLGFEGACTACGLLGELTICEICCCGYHNRCSNFRTTELYPSDGIFLSLFEDLPRRSGQPLVVLRDGVCSRCRINTVAARKARQRRHAWQYNFTPEEKQLRFICIKLRQWSAMEPAYQE